MTPALAPRMSLISEEAGKSRPKMRHSAAKGYIKNKKRLNEEKENTGIIFFNRANQV